LQEEKKEEGSAEEGKKKKPHKQKKVPKQNLLIQAVAAALPDLPIKMSRLLLHEDMEVRLCAAAVLALCVRDSSTVVLLNTRSCFRNLCETLETCLEEHTKQAARRREAARAETRNNRRKKKLMNNNGAGGDGAELASHHNNAHAHRSHAARHAHHLSEKVAVRVKSRTLEDEEMLMTMTRFLSNIMHGACDAGGFT
jgi:hypothetical protein